MKQVKITISPEFIFTVVGNNLIIAREEPSKELPWTSLKRVLPHVYEFWEKLSKEGKMVYLNKIGFTLQKYYGFKDEDETVMYVLNLAKKHLLPLLTN